MTYIALFFNQVAIHLFWSSGSIEIKLDSFLSYPLLGVDRRHLSSCLNNMPSILKRRFQLSPKIKSLKQMQFHSFFKTFLFNCFSKRRSRFFFLEFMGMLPILHKVLSLQSHGARLDLGLLQYRQIIIPSSCFIVLSSFHLIF